MSARSIEPQVLKSCCAALYESEWAQILLGESYHPGGLELTARLGTLLELDTDSLVLDVGSGRGDSAIFLAQHFGSQVVGIDYSAHNVAEARAAAERVGVADRVRFEQADAEALPFMDASFDAVMSECAFCTFPFKDTAAAEFARVLHPGGRVGLSDITRSGALPIELDSLTGWIACLADAQPVEGYSAFLHRAGLEVEWIEPQNAALTKLVEQVRAKLLGAEVLSQVGNLQLSLTDLSQAQAIGRVAAATIRQGRLGYALVVARKPHPRTGGVL